MQFMAQLKDAIYSGDAATVEALTRGALGAGVAVDEILSHGLIAAMERVGVDFRSGELFVPEVLMSAKAMKVGLELIRPILIEQGIRGMGLAVLATVKGDLHDIGKNLVGMMLEGAGFEVMDLGVSVEEGEIIEVVQNHKPAILGLSAMLTTTMPMMGSIIAALQGVGLRDSVVVMVGGAPVTATYAQDIGADGYAPDASAAAELAKQFVSSAV